MLTIKEWRRAKGFSQKTMADKLNIHINTYINWENNPSGIKYSKVQEIAEILGVEISEIKFLP